MKSAVVKSLALSLLCFALPLRAQDSGPQLTGYVKSFAFVQAVEPYDMDRAGARLQLALSGGDDELVSYYGAFDFELNSALLDGQNLAERGGGFALWPVELYANLSLGDVDLRVGQQFIFWGRTSWVNPTDVVSAWDYAHIASEIEDYRVAPLALRANWYAFEGLMLDLVWLPMFQPHRIAMQAPVQMGSLPVEDLGTQLPGPSLDNSELGLRLTQSISAWALDWSLAGFVGHDKFPAIDVHPVLESVVMGPPGSPPVMMPTSLQWQQKYQRLLMLGGDFAKALGPLVIKGEAALKTHPLLGDDDEDSLGSRAEYVLGVDYTWSQDLQLELQYIGKHRLYYDAEAQRQALQQMGRAGAFVEEATDHQLSLRVQARVLSELSLQALVLYDLVYQDLMGLSFVSWDIVDALKLYVGLVAFGGMQADTPLARQADYSRVFVELKYSY